MSAFVGRRDETTAVASVLVDRRLVTLTGTGGVGKTRLAVEAAAGRLDRWRDGAWWVELGSLTDPGLVADLAASVCGVLVEPIGGPVRSLSRQLRDQRVLVCLDNCEHLLDACAELAESLLRTCPDVTVLATSREPLGVAGETVWPVPPLAEDEAVALFADRARRVRPGFVVDAANEAPVRTLCRRLDGIPLAIELAAAWSATLTPAQIAAGLDDRFALLVRGPRDGSARQRTLVASIDWSHDLLDETDRVVLRRLSAFAGDFALDAARAVAAGGVVADTDVLIAIGRLVDKSLLRMDERDGEARYRLSETVRQYAAERLARAGETEATHDRHLDHHLALAEAAEPELEAAGQGPSLARLEAEHDDLRAALDRGLAAADPERGRRLAAALVWFWRLRGRGSEATELLERAIARAPDDRSPLQARLLTGLAWVADAPGPRQVEAAFRGLDLATAHGDDLTRGRCLLLSAYVQFYVDFGAAHGLSVEARASAEAAGDRYVADSALILQGVILCSRDRHDEARPILHDGLARCRARGDRGRAAWALGYLSESAARTGDLRLADELAIEGLSTAGPLQDWFTVGFATGQLALVTGMAGDIPAARRLMRTMARSTESDDDALVPGVAPVMANLALWAGDLDDAVSWFQRQLRAVEPQADGFAAAASLPGLAGALRRLGRLDEAHAHVDRGLALAQRLGVPRLEADSLDEAAGLLDAGGSAGRGSGDLDAAVDLVHQALAIRVDHGLRTSWTVSLDALARLAARAGNHDRAARLLAASDAARTAMGYPRPPVDRAAHDALVADVRAASGDRFATTWAEGAALSLDEAVALARRARGARGRPSSGWASLTPTEQDVARLVAEGLTNPQIAARLLMSRATVKTHLGHIYGKLGVANRTELARLAALAAAGRG